jgi:hypothetical protein
LPARNIENSVRGGESVSEGSSEQIDQTGTRMAKIDVHPDGVGVLDFQTRLPSALGGIS